MGDRYRQGRPSDPGTRQEPTRTAQRSAPIFWGRPTGLRSRSARRPACSICRLARPAGCTPSRPTGTRGRFRWSPAEMFLRALDIETGKRVWEVPQSGAADSWGGVLSTAGGVVFFGEDSGALAAVDAKTGRALWHVQTNASAELGDGHSWRASPMTYHRRGKAVRSSRGGAEHSLLRPSVAGSPISRRATAFRMTAVGPTAFPLRRKIGGRLCILPYSHCRFGVVAPRKSASLPQCDPLSGLSPETGAEPRRFFARRPASFCPTTQPFAR